MGICVSLKMKRNGKAVIIIQGKGTGRGIKHLIPRHGSADPSPFFSKLKMEKGMPVYG
jgi:hypothetical protein